MIGRRRQGHHAIVFAVSAILVTADAASSNARIHSRQGQLDYVVADDTLLRSSPGGQVFGTLRRGAYLTIQQHTHQGVRVSLVGMLASRSLNASIESLTPGEIQACTTSVADTLWEEGVESELLHSPAPLGYFEAGTPLEAVRYSETMVLAALEGWTDSQSLVAGTPSSMPHGHDWQCIHVTKNRTAGESVIRGLLTNTGMDCSTAHYTLIAYSADGTRLASARFGAINFAHGVARPFEVPLGVDPDRIARVEIVRGPGLIRLLTY